MFLFLLFLKTKNVKKKNCDQKKYENAKRDKKDSDKKNMEMTLVMKSKNVCLLYLPVISGEGGTKDRQHFN